MPPPLRKLCLDDNNILQSYGGVGALRDCPSIAEIKREAASLKKLANLSELGADCAHDIKQHGYMLFELPGWLSDLLKPYKIDRYVHDVGSYSGMVGLNGKRLLSRSEPLDNTRAFDEAAGGLAAVARLIATALLGHRQNDVLTSSAIGVLTPVDGAYTHASVAHINIYSQQEEGQGDQPSAYSPHTDGGLLTLVTCPVSDRALVVQRPGGGEEHVPLEPGVAAVLPGEALGRDLHPCAAPRFAPPYRATRHHVDRGMVAGERASVTFHLRPHPDALLSDMQTAGEFMERFYGGVQRINAQRTAHAAAAAPAAVPTADAAAAAPPHAANTAPAATAASAAAAPEAAWDDPDTLEVYIKWQDGREQGVRVRLETLAARLYAYCNKQREGMYKLVLDGVRMDPRCTMEWHGVQHGDVIDALVEQIGD